MTHENFHDFIHDQWNPTTPLTESLSSLSEKLQTWSKDIFHNIFKTKKILLARLDGLQSKLSTHPHRGLIKLEAKIRRELEEVMAQEELHWYQKSRVEWLRNGDRNTTFFQLSSVVRQWKNKVMAIKNQDGGGFMNMKKSKITWLRTFLNFFRMREVMKLQTSPWMSFLSSRSIRGPF